MTAISNQQSTISNQVWHPYTQMQTAGPPVNIIRGEGAYLYDDEGHQYIDGISSWWTNIHGHAHPYIAEKIYEQAKRLEQVIFAGFTHPPAGELAGKLLQRIPYHSKIFYSDNGSTAVEVAIKMALQYWRNKGSPRNKVIAFRDAYHGDTFGSMSVSARGVFTEPFRQLLFEVLFIDTPDRKNDEKVIKQLQDIIGSDGSSIAAFIFEPLVLGSGGMLMYSEQTLDRLMALCKKGNILCIADEVMTGFGRTGKFFATDYCIQKPDIICLSKGITGGFLPFAATTCTQAIYDAFLSNEKSKMFFHGHSYTANPLGCAAAIASLELFERENTMEKVRQIELQHTEFAKKMSAHPNILNARHRGTILALELKTGEQTGYLNTIRDQAYAFFMERHIILRPLGNIIYILPPYCISGADLNTIYAAMEKFANSL